MNYLLCRLCPYGVIFVLAGSGDCQDHLFTDSIYLSTCGSNQVVLCCGLKLATSVLVLGPHGRGSGAGQAQLLPVTDLGLPGSNYKASHGW